MATPRKKWFRVPDSVLWEDWTDTELATLIRLQAFLNTRWARGGLTPAEACKATLDPSALHAVTKRSRWDYGVASLELALSKVTATSAVTPGSFFLHWPKFAEFQFGSPESRPRVAPSVPHPHPQTHPKRQRAKRPSPEPPDGFRISEAIDELRAERLVADYELWDPLLNLTAPKSKADVLAAMAWWFGEEVSAQVEATYVDAAGNGTPPTPAKIVAAYWRKRKKDQVERWVMERRSRAMARLPPAAEPEIPPELFDAVLRVGRSDVPDRH